MSDDKPIPLFELKWTIRKDGECLDCAEIDAKARGAIFKAMQIGADALLTDGDKPRTAAIDTSVLRKSFSASLTINQIDEQFFLINPQARREAKLRNAILETVHQAGCHPDNIERIAYALKHPVGTAAMLKLTVDECKDTEHLVQKFLKIYREITTRLIRQKTTLT